MSIASKVKYAVGGAALLVPFMASAGTLTPSDYSATIGVGESITINKTVTLDPSGPSTGKVDVFFLADNTGSMGSIINAVQSSASSILNAIAGGDSRFAGFDVGFGVGRYFGDPFEGVAPGNAYQLQQSITTSQTDATNAINNWIAFGGGDTPEANFFALHQVATSGAATDSGVSTGQDTGWRDGAGRVAVWFGDAPSHTETVDQDEAIDALTANDVTVAAINTLSAGSGIDFSGQASAIVAATGGTLTNNVDTSGVVDAILDAVGSAVLLVDLDFLTVGDASGLDISFACTDPLGCSNVEPGESRTFEMILTGLLPGTYTFQTLVDGVSGAVEFDTITVTGDGGPIGVPEPSTIALLGAGLLGIAFAASGRKRI